jgi:NRAMP (natural resistance-associated macrophage protein)-like metal ion transporter
MTKQPLPPTSPADPPAQPRLQTRHGHARRTLLHLLGPGLVAGAADDDPSGIATYSQAGAQFGFGMLWTVVLTYPFMVAIQIVGARIGRSTGEGIVANIRTVFPRWVVMWLVFLVLAANTINIAADLAAMGAAFALVAGGHPALLAIAFGIVCLTLEVLVPYRRYAPFLKVLTMVLLVYVATAFSVHIPWEKAASGAFMPHLALDQATIVMVVAVFGTTISPYVFFWQAAEEVEDMNLSRRPHPLRTMKRGTRPTLVRIGIDTAIGMGFSIGIAASIMVTTAATLNVQGITTITTAAQAAEALRPLAGDLTFYLFAAGIIGTGLLAVPVLAGSAAYAVAEALHWRSSLELAPTQARGFYSIVAGSTFIGALVALSPLDPIQMLFWTAVINGIVAVPVMAVMMVLVSSRKVMGTVAAGPVLRAGGWAATIVMAGVVAALFVTWSAG